MLLCSNRGLGSCGEDVGAVLRDENLVLELRGTSASLLSARKLKDELTSVDTVQPSSHSFPRLRLPCTSAGSIVKQSPGFIVP